MWGCPTKWGNGTQLEQEVARLPVQRVAPPSTCEVHAFGSSNATSMNVTWDILTQGHRDMYKDVHGSLLGTGKTWKQLLCHSTKGRLITIHPYGRIPSSQRCIYISRYECRKTGMSQ